MNFRLTVVVVDVETSLFMFKLRDCLHGRCNEFLKTFVSVRYQASRSSLDAKEQTCCRRNLGSMHGGNILVVILDRENILTRQRRAGKMSLRNLLAGILILGVLIGHINGSLNEPSSKNNSTNDTEEDPQHEDPPPLKVAKFDWDYVSGPLTIILWILLASVAKLGEVSSISNLFLKT